MNTLLKKVFPIRTGNFIFSPPGNKIAAYWDREYQGISRKIRGNQGQQRRIREMGRQGYEKLIVWQNTYKLRRLVYEITKGFPKLEYRRISHMRETARSVKQNIQEGYLRPTLNDYIRFLGISQSSLAELIGDIQDCFDDKLITSEEFKKLDPLAGKTDYLLTRLIQSLHRKKKDGTWNKFVKNFPDSP